MILFKCDVCGIDCLDKVISCQLTFGAKNISTDETRRKTTMYAIELCETCFKRLWKNFGYTDSDITTVRDVL